MSTPPPPADDIPRRGQIIDVRMRVIEVFRNGEYGFHILAEFVRPNGLPIHNTVQHAIDCDVYRATKVKHGS